MIMHGSNRFLYSLSAGQIYHHIGKQLPCKHCFFCMLLHTESRLIDPTQPYIYCLSFCSSRLGEIQDDNTILLELTLEAGRCSLPAMAISVAMQVDVLSSRIRVLQ